MNTEERDLIASLFDRLRRAEGSLQQKDREAEQLINRQVSAQPVAPYQLVQTVIVQEHALRNAQDRIAELERQVADARQDNRGEAQSEGGGVGGFLSGLLGGNRSSSPPQSVPARAAAGAAPPPLPAGTGGVPPGQAAPSGAGMAAGGGGGGGSFLRSALGTAAGVAGGALLFQGIGNLLGHNAGPFSSMMGAGGAGFAGGGGSPAGGSTEVTNNYYGDGGNEGSAHHGQTVGDYADGSNPANEPSGDAGFEPASDLSGGDGGFDDGGGFSDDDVTV